MPVASSALLNRTSSSDTGSMIRCFEYCTIGNASFVRSAWDFASGTLLVVVVSRQLSRRSEDWLISGRMLARRREQMLATARDFTPTTNTYQSVAIRSHSPSKCFISPRAQSLFSSLTSPTTIGHYCIGALTPPRQTARFLSSIRISSGLTLTSHQSERTSRDRLATSSTPPER